MVVREKRGASSLPMSVLTILRYILAFIVIGLFWEVGSLSLGTVLLPSPLETLTLFIVSLGDPVYLSHAAVSLMRLLAGLGVAALVALPLGLWLGHSQRADALGAPLLFITYPLPKIVLLPVFFMLLGLGDASRIVLIALTTGYQMLVIVRASAKSLDPVYKTAFYSMGGTTLQAVRHVYLPAVLPAFLTSMKVASGTAVAVLFLAESFATNEGLGYLIMDAWGIGDTLAMFNGILALSVLGLMLYGSIWMAERVLCPWCRSE